MFKIYAKLITNNKVVGDYVYELKNDCVYSADMPLKIKC